MGLRNTVSQPGSSPLHGGGGRLPCKARQCVGDQARFEESGIREHLPGPAGILLFQAIPDRPTKVLVQTPIEWVVR